jgi:hypothetical protein
MWLALKALLLRWALGRSFGGLFSVLLMLAFPLAGVLKVIGLPLLIVLAIVGFPILLLLFVIGLPILLVVATVGVLMTIVGSLLAVGIAFLKIAIPVVLLFIVLRWIWRRVCARRGDGGPKPDTSTGSATGGTAGAEPAT